jgi:hypothetical protein
MTSNPQVGELRESGATFFEIIPDLPGSRLIWVETCPLPKAHGEFSASKA